MSRVKCCCTCWVLLDQLVVCRVSFFEYFSFQMLSRDCFFFNTVIGLQFFFQSSLDVDSLYVLHVLYALVETNILEHAAHCSQSDLCFGLIRRRLIMVCNVRQSLQDGVHFKYFTFSTAPKQELCTSSLYTRPKLKHEQWTLTPHSRSQRRTVAGCPSVWSPFQPLMTETALISLHWLSVKFIIDFKVRFIIFLLQLSHKCPEQLL